jgi:hypothetical protein
MKSGLKHLKEWLDKNDIADAAKDVGISPQQASNIMAGRCKNWSFTEKIIEKAKKNKALIELANTL